MLLRKPSYHLNKYNTFRNWFIHLVSFFSRYLLFVFFCSQKGGEEKLFACWKNTIICFVFFTACSLVFSRFLNFKGIPLIAWLKKSNCPCLLVYSFAITFSVRDCGREWCPLAASKLKVWVCKIWYISEFWLWLNQSKTFESICLHFPVLQIEL